MTAGWLRAEPGKKFVSLVLWPDVADAARDQSRQGIAGEVLRRRRAGR